MHLAMQAQPVLFRWNWSRELGITGRLYRMKLYQLIFSSNVVLRAERLTRFAIPLIFVTSAQQ